jgi:glycosyltransferase involved in cell wall biosynthesis
MKPVATGWKGLVFWVYRLLFERLVLRRAHRVLASSKDYAEACRVPRADIVAAPFGVSTDFYTPGDQSLARAALNLPPSGPIAVFVGAMDPQHAFKGIPVLLNALAQVPNLTVILVGDGALRPEYEALAKRLGVGERALFLGRLSEEQKVQAYQAADWHILPSTSQSEAFGLVTLEAMSCGKASIVSDLPGVRTLVHDGENGLTVIPGDSASLKAALERFIAEPALPVSLGLRARTIARERYAEEQVNAQLLAELTRAAQSSSEY